MIDMRGILMILSLVLFSVIVQAKRWEVDPQKGGKIQETINKASDGDSIIVLPGVYKEQTIKVTKRISLIGKDFPILDGENKYEILLVEADDVLIEGLHLRNGGSSGYLDLAAIKLFVRRNVTIRNNKVENTFFALHIQRSNNCLIENNIIYSNAKTEAQSGNGIHCWKSDSLTIRNNRISGHRDGIYFEFVTNSLVKGNISSKNVRYGLHFMFSHSDTYVENTFSDNGAGVAVMYTRGVKMLNNIFSENWGSASYGLLLKDITDSDIKGNKFISNTSGIYMEGSSRINITGNLFTRNGWGIKIQASCDDNLIGGNNFLSNTFDIATNGSNSLNTFEANYWDKYEGYDLNRDGVGDIPFRPVSLYSMVVERNPSTMMLFRSTMVSLLDRAEKIIPSITPINLIDEKPQMKPIKL